VAVNVNMSSDFPRHHRSTSRDRAEVLPRQEPRPVIYGPPADLSKRRFRRGSLANFPRPR
jgi:hypothetical protein